MSDTVTEPLLTLQQVAEHLNVTVPTVRRMARRGDIVAYKFGNRWRFDRDEVERAKQRARVPLGER